MVLSALTTEERIFVALFPPKGDIPMKIRQNLTPIESLMAQLIHLANGGTPSSTDSRKVVHPDLSSEITAKIVELWEGLDRPTWNQVAAMVGHGLSANACRNRYRDHQKRQAGSAPISPKSPGGPESTQELVSQKQETEDAPIKPPDAPQSPIHSTGTETHEDLRSGQGSGQGKQTLPRGKRERCTPPEEDEAIWIFHQKGKNPEEIRRIIGTHVSLGTIYNRIRTRSKDEVWKQRRAEAKAAQAEKAAAPPDAPKCDKIRDDARREFVLLGKEGEGEDKGEGIPAQETLDTDEGPQPTPEPATRVPSRATIGAQILKLHEEGFDPEEIAADINQSLGLLYSDQMVIRRLRECGVQL